MVDRLFCVEVIYMSDWISEVEKALQVNNIDKARKLVENYTSEQNLSHGEIPINKADDVIYNISTPEDKGLVEAAQKGDILSVIFYILEGADLETYGSQAIIEASKIGNKDIVHYVINKLVENGLSKEEVLNQENDEGYTPLIIAAKNRNFDMVKFLIEQGADINVKDKNTLLGIAYRYKKIDILNMLLEKEVDLEDEHNIEVIGQIIDNKIRVNRRTLLNNISKKPNIKIINKLIDGNRIIDLTNDEDVEQLKGMLEKISDINYIDDKGKTLLGTSYYYEKVDILNVLLKKGVDLKDKNNVEIIGYIIDDKMEIDYNLLLKSLKETPNIKIINRLIENGKIDLKDSNSIELLREMIKKMSYTDCKILLETAYRYRRVDILSMLIERGLDLKDENNEKIIQLIINDKMEIDYNVLLKNLNESLNVEIVNMLIENNRIDFENNYSIELLKEILEKTLSEVATNCDKVDILLKKGLDLKDENDIKAIWEIIKKSEDKKDILFAAAYKGQLELVKWLVASGVDKNTKDNNGMTALMIAAGQGHIELVKYLVGHELNVNKGTKDIMTALMYAAAGGHLEVVKYLMKEKVSTLNLKNEIKVGLIGVITTLLLKKIKKDKLLMWAAKEGFKEVVKYGLNLNQKNNNEKTALMYAIEVGRKEVVDYLLEYGIDYLKNKKAEQEIKTVDEDIKEDDKQIAVVVAKEAANKANRLNREKAQKEELDNMIKEEELYNDNWEKEEKKRKLEEDEKPIEIEIAIKAVDDAKESFTELVKDESSPKEIESYVEGFDKVDNKLIEIEKGNASPEQGVKSIKTILDNMLENSKKFGKELWEKIKEIFDNLMQRINKVFSIHKEKQNITLSRENFSKNKTKQHKLNKE